MWYIGKDSNNRPYYMGSGKYLKNAINKYGKENFYKIILEECSTKEELQEREIHWITKTDAVNSKESYNLAGGGEGGDLSKYIQYDKIDYSNYKMTGVHKWFNNLTEEEKKEWHRKQGEKRCQGWWISTIKDPDTETYVKNLREWCDDNKVDPGWASSISNPNRKEYGGSAQGYRIRKDWNPVLPPYFDKRTVTKSNKGKKWCISHESDPDNEILITNLKEWCKENNVNYHSAFYVTNPNRKRHDMKIKGWKIRKT